MKILIVDDDSLVSRSLTNILEKEGYLVHSINNGREILDIVHGLKPDVILLDIVLPEVDGFEVLKSLKEDPLLHDIPVIMVTSKKGSIDLKKALDLGAFDYIRKPVEEIEAVARVKSTLRFKKYQDKLKRMATKDSLTGVYNHALLIELLEKELGKKKRASGSLAFCMIDIDYFKKVNDTYGHMSGDLVLKKLADILKKSLRSSDVVGRYGGEEFGIVLPDIDLESTVKLCERIRQTLEEYSFEFKGDTIKVTISIGICHKAQDADLSSSEMIALADTALYKAKQCGRNRIDISEK